MSVLVESIHQEQVAYQQVRIWRQEAKGYSSNKATNFHTICRKLTEEEFTPGKMKGQMGIAKYLLDYDAKINAVEVKDRHGTGVVLYRDWP